MEMFIMNLMLFLECHFGKQVHNPPLRWWINRNDNNYKEVKILNDFNTIVFARANKQSVRAKNHNKPVFIWVREEFGIKVDPEGGVVKMWSRSNHGRGKPVYRKTTFQQLKDFVVVNFEVASIPGVGIWSSRYVPMIPLLDEFLTHHGVASLEQLIIPAAEPLGIGTRSMVRTPWMDFALGARTLDEFWTRLGRTVKLAKDEKRALVAAIKVDEKYIAFARIATRIQIPNIRTLEVKSVSVDRRGYRMAYNDPWGWLAPDSDSVSDWIMGMRNVAPSRRIMFLNNWSRMSGDTLNMLAQIRKAGNTDVLNFRSVDEYHQHCIYQQRLISTPLEEIPMVNGQFYTPKIRDHGDHVSIITSSHPVHGQMIGDIKVVAASDTHEVTRWGLLQDHCIGSYAMQAARGQTILLGFQRNGEWVGHCSITNRRCDQLLARFNRSLEVEDARAILGWLKDHGLIDEAKAGWGMY